MKRIHIVALSPRTGTTLLAECMAACLRIDCFEAHEQPVTRLRRNAGIYLTKRPADLYAVRPRLLVDPHFYVICMVRDPRDVIVSRHGKDPSRYWVPLRVWKERLRVFERMRRHPRFITLRYEDLVIDPDRIQRHLCERLPFLQATHKFSDFSAVAKPSADSIAALGGVRDIEASSIGNWRSHLPRVAGQIQRHGSITPPLVQFGYEPDDSWTRVLDGVTPDMASSHLSERPRRTLNERSQVAQACVSAGMVMAARAVGMRVV